MEFGDSESQRTPMVRGRSVAYRPRAHGAKSGRWP
jgi:hypothetical protein